MVSHFSASAPSACRSVSSRCTRWVTSRQKSWAEPVTRGRFGLWRPKRGRWGTLRLTTTGRRTGRARQVVVGYWEDGPNLVTMAMNGWGEAEPAWWLNLQDHPDAIAETRDGRRQVTARRAQGEERERLWSRWAEIDKNLDDYAARRPTETAVVVLEPRDATEPGA